MRKLLLTAALVSLAMAFSTVALAHEHGNGQAAEEVVRCDKGKSVQHILDSSSLSQPLELRLVGTCAGFTITRDRVSIAPRDDDVCPGATVDGGLFIRNARWVEVRCIAITGGEDDGGVDLVRSVVSFEHVDIVGNDSHGLGVTGLSSARVSNSSINNNWIGVNVDSMGSVSFENTHITSNLAAGVEVSQTSRVTFEGGSITDNQDNGILVSFHSTAAVFGGAAINNNTPNNISVNKDSGVVLRVLVTTGVVCDDLESSVYPISNAPGSTCTEF
jgi:hypothetical protein